MKRLLLVLLVILITNLSQAQDIKIGKQDSIYSQILKETRPFSVYFPPSYCTNSNQKYPVLYILDGDYNFHYVTGLIELQSSISENIPEMIVVGISGKDSKTYMQNCIPEETNSKLQGNANKVFKFINTELVPYVTKKYKVNNYKILSGHSKGGLFVINSALHKPKSFNHYIAISPAVWYEDSGINDITQNILKQNKNFKSDVYISLANEKGMMVDSFLKVATSSVFKNANVVYILAFLGLILSAIFYRKVRSISKLKRLSLALLILVISFSFTAYLLYGYFPNNTNFKFKKFAHENHNSVGAPTYKWALNNIFQNWKLDKPYFESPEGLEKYSKNTKNQYGETFNLSNSALANTVLYILKDDKKALEEMGNLIKKNYPESTSYYNLLLADNLLAKEDILQAKQILSQSLKKDSSYYKTYYKLALIAQKEQQEQLADSFINKAKTIAISQKARQWEVNELVLIKEN
jgi:predicted alpha/beta superfamily hydrolase